MRTVWICSAAGLEQISSRFHASLVYVILFCEGKIQSAAMFILLSSAAVEVSKPVSSVNM